MRKLLIVSGACLFALAGAVNAQETKDMKDMDTSKSATQQGQEQAKGTGVVKAVDSKAGTVTIAHEPIKAFSWPSMTMKFKVADPALLNNIAVGNKVEFSVQGKDMTKSAITAIAVTG